MKRIGGAIFGMLVFSLAAFSQCNDAGEGNNCVITNPTGTQTITNFGLNVLTLNNVVKADQYAGADWCAKVKAAALALPSTGGTVDARGLQGAQTCSANPYATVTVPTTLLIGASTISISGSATWEPPSGSRIFGLGKDKTTIVAPSGLVPTIEINNVTDIEIAGLELRGNSSNTYVTPGIYIYGGSASGGDQNLRVSIHDDLFDEFETTQTPAPGHGQYGAISIANAGTIWIDRNEFTGNGEVSSGGTSPDSNVVEIGTNGAAGLQTQSRIFVRNNWFHGSGTTDVIYLLDTSESEVSGNWIDQNNIGTLTTASISSISRSSNVVSVVTTGSTFTLVVGQNVTIQGVTDSSFNGTFAVASVTDANHFTFNQTGTNASSSGGTAGIQTTEGYGILFYTQSGSVNACQHNRVENNYVQNTSGYGIYMQASHRSVVLGNVLYNVDQKLTTDGSLLSAGIAVTGSTTFGQEGYVVSGNHIENVNSANTSVSNDGDGIATSLTIGAVVSNNTVANTYRNGIDISNLDSGTVVSTNTTASSGYSSIAAPSASSQMSITGNTLSGWGSEATAAAISVTGAVTDSVVANNTVTAPSSSGAQSILFTNSSAARNQIIGNIVNPSGGSSANAIDYRGTSGMITGNKVSNSTNYGINVLGSSTTIQDNDVSASSGYGAFLNTGTANILRNNRFSSNTSGSIDIASSSSIISCSGNVTDGTGTDIVASFPCVSSAFRVATNFTTSSTAPVTITGLTWNLPANRAVNLSFNCTILYSQATAAAADQFGIQTASYAANNIVATSQVATSSSAHVNGTLSTSTPGTGSNAIGGTFTPASTGTIFLAQINGMIENPSNSSANTVNLTAFSGSSSDVLTVYKDSQCTVGQF